MSNSFATGKNAIAICQRSGFKYPYHEMILEPGTGLFIHYSESDGMYNRVDHPQLHINAVGDKIGLQRPHPDVDDAIGFLVDETNEYIISLGSFGSENFIEYNVPLD